MDGIARLCHIVAGGFHAGGRVRSADVEFIDSVSLDKTRNASLVKELLFVLTKILFDTTFSSGTNSAPFVPGLRVRVPAVMLLCLI